jgi:hypothetical protein
VDRTWAVQGAGGLGHVLAQQLVAVGEQVVDVQPKRGARVRLLSSGTSNKNDENDARSVAVAALRSSDAVDELVEEGGPVVLAVVAGVVALTGQDGQELGAGAEVGAGLAGRFQPAVQLGGAVRPSARMELTVGAHPRKARSRYRRSGAASSGDGCLVRAGCVTIVRGSQEHSPESADQHGQLMRHALSARIRHAGQMTAGTGEQFRVWSHQAAAGTAVRDRA